MINGPFKCALCNIESGGENVSKEHIILNAIGGRKKVKGIICKGCNDKSGDNWDDKLAKQLQPLSLFFCITRERGNVPSQTFETTSGNEITLKENGSLAFTEPSYKETPEGSNTRIRIEARSKREAKKMLRGVRRKYPQIDNIEDILASSKRESTYINDMLKLKLNMGGHDAGRSIVKSAFALAVEGGINTEDCEHARDYLQNENSEACFGYYYEKDLVKNRPEGTPLHCVSIRGSSYNHLILGYVEYFGVYRMVLCLSNSYSGPDISKTYSINPVDGQEIDLDIDLTLSHEEIRSAYHNEKIPEGSMESALSKVMPTGMNIQFIKARDRVLLEAYKYACDNCEGNKGVTLTDEQCQKFADLIIEKLEPFLIHHIQRRKRR